LPGHPLSLDHLAIGLDMEHADASLQQGLRDEQMTVTVVVVAFATHHNYLLGASQVEQSSYAVLVGRRLLQALVVRTILSGVVQSRIVRMTAERVAHEPVGDAGVVEIAGQDFTIELRRPTAVGLAAHVHDEGDVVAAQQVDKGRYGMITMADGVNHWFFWHRALSFWMVQPVSLIQPMFRATMVCSSSMICERLTAESGEKKQLDL
jgi:hypothetical protein